MPHYQSSHAGYILHERAEQYYGEGTGFLSIKSFFHGQALYSVGRGQYAANDRSYLVLNHGQPYTISIEADRPVESFCLFFAPGFAETVQYSLTTAADRILLEPQALSIPPLTFFDGRTVAAAWRRATMRAAHQFPVENNLPTPQAPKT